MTTPADAPGYRPNPLYTQEDWNEVCDNPEMTAEELAMLRPAREVLSPELYAALTAPRTAQPEAAETSFKVAVTLRLDHSVIERFKAQGPDWETRINDALSQFLTAGRA